MSFKVETYNDDNRQPQIHDLVKIKGAIGIIINVRINEVEVYIPQDKTWRDIHTTNIIYADDATITFNNNIKEND